MAEPTSTPVVTPVASGTSVKNQPELPLWTNNRLIGGLLVILIVTVGGWFISLHQRIISLEHRVQSDVDRLLEKTANIEDLQVSTEVASSNIQALTQKVNDHIADITDLKAKVNAAEINAGKFETAINDYLRRILTLETDSKNICANLTLVRERVARIESASDDAPIKP